MDIKHIIDDLMQQKSNSEEDKETKARREQYDALKKEFG